MKFWSLFCIWIVLTQISAAQSSINKVVCADSTASQLIQCGENQIIDIQNVTIGILTNCMNIPEMQRFGQFYALHPLCVRSLKKDGEGVYRRCHGEQSCTLDGSVVPVEQLTSQTDVCGWTTSTALWFSYSCQYVRLWKPHEISQTAGTELHIFSQCFPSYTPNSTVVSYEVDCAITPESFRTIQHTTIQFKIIPKLVKMYPGRMYCRDYLFFNRGSSSDPQHNKQFGRYYCGRDGVQVEVWNEDVISTDTIHDIHITYRALTEAAGTKYWFLVTATEERSPVKITATCNGTRISSELICPASQATRPPPPTVTTKTTTTTPTTTKPPPPTTTKIASHVTPSTTTNSSTRSDALLPEIGKDPIKDGEDAGVGSTGLVIGLVIAVVVSVVLAVFGAIVTWKLRKRGANENKTSANSNDTNKYAPDPTTNYQDAYEIIPDHLVNRESGNDHPNPVMSTTPVTTVADPSAYEEVQQASTEESKPVKEITEQSTGEYEDISPKDKPYESLRRAVYENAAETPELKVYAGLDQTKRHSTA